MPVFKQVSYMCNVTHTAGVFKIHSDCICTPLQKIDATVTENTAANSINIVP